LGLKGFVVVVVVVVVGQCFRVQKKIDFYDYIYGGILGSNQLYE